MTDKFLSAVLTALNESAEVKESDWNSIEAVLRGQAVLADTRRKTAVSQVSDNRFAATISCGMAKIRAR
jgi:predicted negative regulator of RcsB-dependent stress response